MRRRVRARLGLFLLPTLLAVGAPAASPPAAGNAAGFAGQVAKPVQEVPLTPKPVYVLAMPEGYNTNTAKHIATLVYTRLVRYKTKNLLEHDRVKLRPDSKANNICHEVSPCDVVTVVKTDNNRKYHVRIQCSNKNTYYPKFEADEDDDSARAHAAYAVKSHDNKRHK